MENLPTAIAVRQGAQQYPLTLLDRQQGKMSTDQRLAIWKDLISLLSP
jgi:hypothetical protein